MELLTIEEVINWAQDPLRTCGGSPVILSATYLELAQELATYTDQVSLTVEEIVVLFKEQSKRFSACGANFGGEDNLTLIRKNPETGWQYILDLIK